VHKGNSGSEGRRCRGPKKGKCPPLEKPQLTPDKLVAGLTRKFHFVSMYLKGLREIFKIHKEKPEDGNLVSKIRFGEFRKGMGSEGGGGCNYVI